MRIIHLSDIHIWRYAFNPMWLMNKRAFGMLSLLKGRARRFRLERLSDVVERVRLLKPDHVLITGDLTTTALPIEFQAARVELAELLIESDRATVIPGNHDRYTTGAVRSRHFEEWFGAFAPESPYPWLRWLDPTTAILGLDATRSHISATGRLPKDQLDAAQAMLDRPEARPKRLIVACHYPLTAPPTYVRELSSKRMTNAGDVAHWLSTLGPHLFCCGHVHAAWAFHPQGIPGQLCLNAGAPLLRDRTGHRPPGFLEIRLDETNVTAIHHAWHAGAWETRSLIESPGFFDAQMV